MKMMELDLIVGSGGVLSHAPRRVQSMRMMIDSFEPEGVTELAVDSIFMMPHLGVLSSVNEEAATQVFERDCIIYLGTCVAPIGDTSDVGPEGRPALDISLTYPSGDRVERTLNTGKLFLVEATRDEEVQAVVTPLIRSLDLGEGPGKPLHRALRGGEVGIVFDTRGRSIYVPSEPTKRVPKVQDWVRAMGEYPEGDA